MGFFRKLFGTYLYEDHRATVHKHGHRCYSEGLTHHEQHIVSILASNLNPDKYYLFNNVILPSSNSVTTQIDHIVVSEYGIFVIESKDYGGWIFGNKNRNEWTQSMIRGKKYRFQNPLHQNLAHIFALKEHMPFLKNCIYNLVVFSNRSVFKTSMPTTVMHDEEVVDYILEKTKPRLSDGELMMAIGKLSMLCQTTQVTNEQHVENLEVVHKAGGLVPIPLPSQNRVSS